MSCGIFFLWNLWKAIEEDEEKIISKRFLTRVIRLAFYAIFKLSFLLINFLLIVTTRLFNYTCHDCDSECNNSKMYRAKLETLFCVFHFRRCWHVINGKCIPSRIQQTLSVVWCNRDNWILLPPLFKCEHFQPDQKNKILYFFGPTASLNQDYDGYF